VRRRDHDDLTVVLLTIAVVLLPALLLTGDRTLLFGEAALALAAALVALVAGLTRLPRADRSAFARALAPRRTPIARPPDLERLERDVLLATGVAREFELRLRPLLRRACAARLREHGVADAALDPEGAARVLGPELAAIAGDAPLDDTRRDAADLARLLDDLDRVDAGLPARGGPWPPT
jgi:hypothetical protein